MRLVIVSNDQQKEEILSGTIDNDCRIDWIKSPAEVSILTNYDALFDLLFEDNSHDHSYLKVIDSKPVFFNAVTRTIGEIGQPVIRINGWPGFLKRSVAEVSCVDNNHKEAAEKALRCLNKRTEWVPDVKGFISARVIGMIINEAYFALEENVSTKDEIDTAMKLGTNYPYGPFEWSQKIGLKKIAELLLELSGSEKRYTPSKLLLKEAEQ